MDLIEGLTWLSMDMYNEPIDHYAQDKPTPLTPLSCLHQMPHHLSIANIELLHMLSKFAIFHQVKLNSGW